MSQFVQGRRHRLVRSNVRAAAAAAAAAAALAAGLVPLPGLQRAAHAGQWLGTAGGNWSTTGGNSANWDNNITPNAVGALAQFNSLNANRAVSLTSNVTVGEIDFFATTGGGYSVTSSNRTITFDNVGPLGEATWPALISVQSGNTQNHSITAALALADVLNVDFAGTATGTLTLSGTISQNVVGEGITKTGGGVLLLSGSNNSFTGPLNINGGTFRVSGGTALSDSVAVVLGDVAGATFDVASSETIRALVGGGATGGAVTLASGATLTLNDTTNTPRNYAGSFSGAGNLTQSGVNTVTLGGTSLSIGGTTTVSGGTLQVTNTLSTGTLNRTAGSITVGTFTVSTDYTNSNFGTGNAFATHGGTTGVSAGVAINAAGTSDQSITSGTATVTDGATATPSIDLGKVRPSTNSTFNIAYGGDTSAPTLRGAIQTSGLVGTPLTVDSIVNANGANFANIANGGSQAHTLNVGSTAGGPISASFGIVNNFDDVLDQTVTVTGTAYRLATRTVGPGSIAFGNVREGASVTATNVTITNASAADGYSDDLQSAFGTITGAGAANVIATGGPVTMAAGASNTPGSMTISIDTATAGTRAAAVPTTHTSVPTVTGLSSVALANANISITGSVWRYASGQVTTPVAPTPLAFGIRHVGDVVALQSVLVKNTAASDGFSDNLFASLSATDNPGITLTNPVAGAANIAPQATSSGGASGLRVSLNTATAGSRDGNVTVSYTSNPTVTGLDTGHSVGSENVAVTGQVNNFAAASISKNSGAGSLTGGANTYTLDLGTIVQSAGSATADLAISNVGGITFTDLLNGTFDVSGSGSFTLAGFDTFFTTGGIAGGDTRSGLGVTLPDSLSPNTYTGALVFTPHSTNAAPYDQPLASGNITINLTGVVQSAIANGIWLGGNGTWGTAGGWSNSVVPNSSTLSVKIDNANAATSAVTLDTDATVADVTLDAADSLAIDATRTLTIAGPGNSALAGAVNNSGTIDVQAGTATLSGGGTHAGTFSVAGGATLELSGTHVLGAGSNVTGAGTLLVSGGTTTIASPSTHSGATNVTGGMLVVADGGALGTAAVSIGTGAAGQLQAGITTAVTLNTLSIAGTGTFDVTNNSMVIKGMADTQVRSLLQSGYNAGHWDGPAGITSSTAAASTETSVGYAINSSLNLTEFKGVSGLSASDVLVKYTYAGDANLDGKVDIGDLGLLAGAWQQSGKVWFDGDFTYNGTVDIGDLGLLAGNWQKGVSSGQLLVSFDQAMAQFAAFDGVVVPEPASLSLLALGGGLALGRRRRLVRQNCVRRTA